MRSVFAQAKDAADEMVRKEKLRRERAAALAAIPPSRLAADYVAKYDSRVGLLNYDPRRDITAADQLSVVRPSAPIVSAAELAERRRGLERVFYMANNPLAAAGYGIASIANAPQHVRDGALAVGGLLDAAMLGGAPRGAPIRPYVAPPRIRSAPPPTPRDPVREVNARGQAIGANPIVTPQMIGTGTRAYWRIEPPGWGGNGNEFKQDPAHVWPRELGGSGRRPKDLTTATADPTNRKQKRAFDRQVADRVRAGEVVDYSSTPSYIGSTTGAPTSYLMTVNGPIGGPRALIVGNPAGWRPK